MTKTPPKTTSHIKISCYHNPDDSAFTVEVSDCGKGFDVNGTGPTVDTDSPGGRGLRLMRALTDRVDLLHEGVGMTVSLTKYLQA